MMKKAYISNICRDWTIERQRELLAGIESVYLDKLGPKAIKGKDSKKLIERASMLRPTSRRDGEVIVVVDWPVLAFTWQELAKVAALAAARNATLHSLHRDERIEPGQGVEALGPILEDFAKRVRGRGLQKTREERAQERRDDARRRADLIAEDWPKSEQEAPMAELLMRAGPRKGVPMAPATAKKYLGSRWKAQKATALIHRQQMGQAAARGRKKGTPND